MSALRQDGADWLLDVRVQPRAARTGFAGVRGDRLCIRLNAPPVDGRANAALVEFVADACGIAKSCVTLVKGQAGRDKRLRLRGLREVPAALQAALAAADASS